MTNAHSFHIPVLGIGYTADTPLKVSHLGIDSVISLVDDTLLEKLRKMYCQKAGVKYDEIPSHAEDSRARRITSYLNLLNDMAEKKFEELKNSAAKKGNEIKEYFNMLPDRSALKKEFMALVAKHVNTDKLEKWVHDNLHRGSIDVNIMTKVDKENFSNGEKLPSEFNDAHAALRGFANSNLESSIVFSAGMNPSLFSYLENFEDFYPTSEGYIKKKIILKVSDFRSAMIQGKFLAKKGLWVSEYRIESGLNCGGHAFATDGYLLGPILEEFRTKREELSSAAFELLSAALSSKNKPTPETAPQMRISAQGGIGTAEEHQFLIDHYGVDSVGWGTPFLLVPEAVNIDEETLELLENADEKQLYLSDISPLGVPFNSVRGNTKDIEKDSLIDCGTPGSKCQRRKVALNYEFTSHGICTASRQYQELKINQLKGFNLPLEEFKQKFKKIVEKACICVGLGTPALLVNNLDTKIEGNGVSVCPGPNMAYFSNKMTLKEIVDHIYGRKNVIKRKDRPHVFVKELNIYLDYLRERLNETKEGLTEKQEKYYSTFVKNLNEGIDYYCRLFGEMRNSFADKKESVIKELQEGRERLKALTAQHLSR